MHHLQRFASRLPTTLPFQLIGLLLLAPLFALAPLRVALAVVGVLGVLALAWIGPVWGVYLTILSVPVQQLVLLPGGTSCTQAAVLLMTGAWVLRAISQPRAVLVTGPLFWAWLALLAALLLSASFTPYSLDESLRATLRWGVAFLVWFVAVNTVRQRWQVMALVGCVLAAPAANALLGVYQFVSGNGPPSFRIAENLRFIRAYGTIGQPNSFAGYMNMVWPLAVALGWATGLPMLWWSATRQSIPRIGVGLLLTFIAAITGAALLASFSLGGWIGALVGVVGLLAALGWRWAVAAFGGTAALLGVVALGGLRMLPAAISGRVTRLTGMLNFFDPATVTVTPDNFALVERMAQMKAGWLMFLAHPLFGVGPGNYTNAYSDVAQAPWYASRGHAHNFYLHMAAETGLIGLAAYLALIATTVVLAIRALRLVQGRAARGAIIGCCGIIAAVAGHNLFENLHVLNLGVQLSSVWALLVLIPNVGDGHPTPD